MEKDTFTIIVDGCKITVQRMPFYILKVEEIPNED